MIRLAEGKADQAALSPGAGTASQPFDVAEAYDRYGREIFGFSLNAVRDRGAAEDYTQETFTRAWRARDRYDPERSSLRTWLFAIARNVVIDAYRRGAKTPDPIDEGQIDHLHAHEPDPLQRLMLIEALATLSPDHRQAVVAIHITGLSYAELSASTDVPVNTLRTRTYYGLRQLRRYLDPREVKDE